MTDSLDLIAGDHATYSLDDGQRAVEMARAGTITVDIETKGLGERAFEITAIGIGNADHACVIDPAGRAASAVRDACAVADRIVLHNSPFDVPPLVFAGLMSIDDVAKVHDTVIDARLASPHEHSGRSLAQTCDRYLPGGYGAAKGGLEAGFKAVHGGKKSDAFEQLDTRSPAHRAYTAFDIIATARVHPILGPAVAEFTADHPFPTTGDAAHLIEREQTVNRILLRRSALGIEVDFDVVDELKAEMLAAATEAEAVLASWGVDTSLSRELMKKDAVRVLDEAGILPASYKRLKDGTPSADKTYLDKVNHEIVDAIVVRSQADRFAADYADKLIHLSGPTGRIHPQVAVQAARTGRMSYGTPPLQQFPARVRRMMRFDQPVTSMDWSSIEPVFFANIVGETDLLETFEGGGDLYQPIADLAGVGRPIAKMIVLAQIYGQGPLSLSTRLGRGEDEVREIIGRVMEPMPKIRKAKKVISTIGEMVGLVQTVSGRIVPLDRDPRSNGERFFGYKGVNYVVQGSCYDLLAEVMLSMHRAGLSDHVHAAVHDELVVSTEVADEVERIMLEPAPAFVREAGRVPVLRVGRADIGHHWLEKE